MSRDRPDFFSVFNLANRRSSSPTNSIYSHFVERRDFRQLHISQGEAIPAQDQPLQSAEESELLHGQVVQLVVHQEQPLQAVQALEGVVGQVADVVVAQLQALQVE